MKRTLPMRTKNKLTLFMAITFFSMSFDVFSAESPSKNSAESNLSEPYQKRKRKEWVKIEITDIPAPIKITLSKREYNGWENSKMFRSRSSNVYLFEISESGNAEYSSSKRMELKFIRSEQLDRISQVINLSYLTEIRQSESER